MLVTLIQRYWKTLFIYVVITVVQLWIIGRYYEQKYANSVPKREQVSAPLPPETPMSQKISFEDLAILKEKVVNDISSPVAPVSVTMKVVQQTGDEVRVELSFVGNDTTKLYASDIVLRVPQGSVASADVEAGTAFPQYLRSAFDGETLIITGGAAIRDNTISFGQPNRVFATVVFKKKNRSTSVSVTLDTTRTAIYYQTQDLLDRSKSIAVLKI